MIRGVVNAHHEAIVSVRVRGPSGVETTEAAVLDTGFTDSLALPPPMIARLGLQAFSQSQADMADGSVCTLETFSAEVEWDGAWRAVLVYGLGSDCLIGMRLLAGHEVRIAVEAGGAVEITSLP